MKTSHTHTKEWGSKPRKEDNRRLRSKDQTLALKEGIEDEPIHPAEIRLMGEEIEDLNVKCEATDLKGWACFLPEGHNGTHCNPMRNGWGEDE